jgi:RNA polymerase sigma-70 factor (ECF subfamily)
MASIAGDKLERLPGGLELQTVIDERAPVEDEEDESPLVEAARRGDRAAFGRLYDRYGRMVHGILLARVPDREVDDLVHDVFLQALPRLHTLRDVKRFGAWLAAITRNRANDYHRHAVEEIELSEEGEQEQERRGTGRNSLDGKDAETAFVLAAIRALPETYRETLLLRLVEGMTGPEIAARTGLTPGSVRVNLHRGMQQLREKLSHTTRGKPRSG